MHIGAHPEIKQTMKFLIHLILITTIVFPSCGQSNEALSREEAQEIIVKSNPYPVWETLPFPTSKIVTPNSSMYTKLKNGGYITLKEHRSAWQTTYSMALSDKSNEYYVETAQNPYSFGSDYWMKVYIKRFHEITGIQTNEHTGISTVEYTIKLTSVTPFGEAKGYYENQIVSKTIDLVQYDDGWRVRK